MQLIRDSAKALSMRDCAYTFLAESQFLLNFIVFDAAVFKSIASPLQLIVKRLLRRVGHIHTIIPFISSLTPPQSSATVWGGVSHNNIIASSPRAPPFYGNVCRNKVPMEGLARETTSDNICVASSRSSQY